MADKKRGDGKPLSERELKWLREHEREVERAREKLQRRAKKLKVRIEDLKDERQEDLKKARTKREKEKRLEEAIEKALAEQLDRRGCIDGATSWRGLILVHATVEAKTAYNGQVNSADRTSHADDCGDKMSQAELYAAFLAGHGAPANPPGAGTHEGICDSTFARITGRSTGSKLPWFMWGLDLSDGGGFVSNAQRLGFKCVRPYGHEAWHVNMTADPTSTLKKIGVI